MKMKRAVALGLAVLMIVAASVAGTVAWLQVETDPVVNTFTTSNIDITLTETDTTLSDGKYIKNFQMVPGNDITKDPKVSVDQGSEDCYLFVKVVKSANYDDFMGHAIADGWTALAGEDGVYYRVVNKSDTARNFSVLAGDKVTVKTTVTKSMMDAIDLGTAAKPTLTFTAYAVQKANVADAADAWKIAQGIASS